MESRTWLSMKNYYLRTLKDRKTSSVEDKGGDVEENMEVDESEEEVDDVEGMEDDGGEIEDGEDEVVPTCIIVDF